MNEARDPMHSVETEDNGTASHTSKLRRDYLLIDPALKKKRSSRVMIAL